MNRRHLTPLLGLLTCLVLAAVATARSDAEGATQGERESLLWRVSDGERSLLLLGSIHVLREQDLPLPPPVLEAYTQSDVLIMELDLTAGPAGELQRKYQDFGAASPLRPLNVALGDRYEHIAGLLREAGVDPAGVNGFDPWFLATLLLNGKLQQLGFRGDLGVEAQLTALATKDGRPMGGLETISEQLSAFENLPAEVQTQMLSEALEELDTLREVTARTIDAWRRADTDTLRTELLDSLGDEPALYDALVARRNERWVASLVEMMASDPVELVVVGSLHLLGDDSVVALLAKRGLQLEALW